MVAADTAEEMVGDAGRGGGYYGAPTVILRTVLYGQPPGPTPSAGDD